METEVRQITKNAGGKYVHSKYDYTFSLVMNMLTFLVLTEAKSVIVMSPQTQQQQDQYEL
jgi:hypothetical protein